MCDKKGLEAGRQPWTYCVWRSCVDNLENMPQVLRRDLDERLVAIMGACGGTGVNKTPRLVLKAVHGNPPVELPGSLPPTQSSDSGD